MIDTMALSSIFIRVMVQWFIVSSLLRRKDVSKGKFAFCHDGPANRATCFGRKRSSYRLNVVDGSITFLSYITENIDNNDEKPMNYLL